MSLFVLSREESRALAQIARGPLPIGDIPQGVQARLRELKLVCECVGHCAITPRGQLEVFRQRFRETGRAGTARISRRRRLYLLEAEYEHVPASRHALEQIVQQRRLEDARIVANRDPAAENGTPPATAAPVSDAGGAPPEGSPEEPSAAAPESQSENGTRALASLSWSEILRIRLDR